MGWLTGKRALVAGAGSGIGRAVLGAFLAEGAQVAALELDQAKAGQLASAVPGCVAVQGDATSPADARAAVEAAVGSFGGLDVLVNCVGIFDFYRGLADIDDDQLDAAFDEMFAVNVKSQLVTVRAALPELRRAGGSVVLTVSTSGFYPGRGGVLYVASKFAVRGCVVALAHELAPEVRVNGVAPGGTLDTELTGPRSLGLDGQVLGATEGREQDLRRRTPLRVALAGEDHAGSYVFLASDRARGITGTVVHSDGGIGIRLGVRRRHDRRGRRAAGFHARRLPAGQRRPRERRHRSAGPAGHGRGPRRVRGPAAL
jgi:NAD(P)-dependent dehydrogenase (short-subunit alcohol dehydrogenase family)